VIGLRPLDVEMRILQMIDALIDDGARLLAQRTRVVDLGGVKVVRKSGARKHNDSPKLTLPVHWAGVGEVEPNAPRLEERAPRGPAEALQPSGTGTAGRRDLVPVRQGNPTMLPNRRRCRDQAQLLTLPVHWAGSGELEASAPRREERAWIWPAA
jgi:hypothetical protein